MVKVSILILIVLCIRNVYARLVSDGELREKQTANYFSDIYPIDCAVLPANAQSYPKCCTLLPVLLSA